MSSMVCRGVQSCFELLLFEPCGLRNNLFQPKPNQWPQIPITFEHQNEHQENPCYQEDLNSENKNSKHNSVHKIKNNGDVDDWSFIQALSNKKEANLDENVYVHPLVKKFSSVLSHKSLEMCTESLGSETGSDEFAFPLSPKTTNEEYRNMWRLKYKIINKKFTGNNNFPPPLTSISGSGSVQVTPHREGGRLVLKAATVSPSDSYFQAERVDGRLTLRLVEDNSSNCEEYEDEEYEDEEYENNEENWVEDIGGNNEHVGSEMEIGERPVPSRCKVNGNENKRRPNWEPCWVAIS